MRVARYGHRDDAGVQSEAKGQIVVAAGLEQGERAFQVIPRFAILSGEPACDPGARWATPASGESGLASTSLQEGLGVRPHRRQLAAHVAAGPQAVVGRQPSGASSSPAADSRALCEGFRRFRRAEASRRDQRVAVGDVQLSVAGSNGRAACRPPRRRARLVRHGDRLAEMGDRLLEGGAAQRLVARLAPPFDRQIVEAGLR